MPELKPNGIPPAKTSMRHQRGLPVVKPRNLRGTLLRLWNLTRGHRQGLSAVFLLSGFASLSAMLTPFLIGRIIDHIDALNPVPFLLTGLLLVYLADWAIRFLQSFLMASVSQNMICFIRKSLFYKMKDLPLSYFDKSQHGDLMSRLTNDIDNISTTISDSVTQLMMLAFTLTGILCIMIWLNIWLTLTALITVPFVFLLTKTITKHTRKLYRAQQNVLGSLNGHIEESISGLSLVKAFGRESQITEEFQTYNESLCRIGTKALIWSGYLMPIMNVINNLGFICITVVSGIMASQGLISVGVISSFLLYSRQFTRPLIEVSNIFNVFQTAVAGAERIFDIFDETPEPADKPDALTAENPKGEVVFDHVWFGYHPENPILKDLSFTVPSGTRIAIVGPTGAGKTTIISLLARFYDVTGGRILLDGIDLRDYKKTGLRNSFGIVLQDTALFYLSIRENIRYGRENATDEEVVAASIAAGAHSFITRLPKGYDTLVGEDGGSFSQGERQLITIARAILADAPILVLDEATSSVDTRTEQKIREAVLQLTQNRTSFIIAHRLSTIRDSDVILLLKDGEIAEMGNHAELIARKGLYYEMYQTQMGL